MDYIPALVAIIIGLVFGWKAGVVFYVVGGALTYGLLYWLSRN